jgi:signal transduction histidine kinase
MKNSDLVQRLRDAVVTVASGLELGAVLENVVEAAATLLDARYAALGVVGEDDALSEFVHTGFDGDLAKVSHPPHGRGILGLLVSEGKSLRLRDVSRHPAYVGFPEGHPPMQTFVGVPIVVRDAVYGRLYITDKRVGEFTESDEQLALALAATAGAAVHNALLYGATRLRERSLDAIREITSESVSGSSDDRVLELIAKRARDLLDADVAVICVPRAPAVDGLLDVRAAAGAGAAQATGSTVSAGDSLAGEVLRRRQLVTAKWVPVELESAMAADTGSFASRETRGGASGGPQPKNAAARETRGGAAAERRPRTMAVGVPLLIRGVPFGALTLVVRRFGDEHRRLTETFANHASVMLEYVRTKAELERLLLIEERERIGRDLHDSVIQRLFATGLELQTLAFRYEQREPDLAERLTHAAEGLDDTITQIRATIFALQPPDIEESDSADVSVARIHEMVTAIVAESTRALGFEPEVVLAGDPGHMVSGILVAHMLVVVREGLSNVARHAAATAARVEIKIADTYTVRVSDNGVGFVADGSTPTGYGLQNMREHARSVGGEFDVSSRTEGGTVLEWQVRASATI